MNKPFKRKQGNELQNESDENEFEYLLKHFKSR